MKKLFILLLFLIVSITLGTTWIVMKLVTETIPPIFGTGMRFLLASPLLIILCYLNNVPFFFPTNKIKYQFIISLFYFFIPFTLMLYSSIYISSFFASVIFSTMPIFIIIISCIYFKTQTHFLQIIGVTISLFSFFIILLSELLYNIQTYKGILTLLIAVISHAWIYVYTKKKCKKISILTFNTLPSLFSGLMLLILSYFIENPVIQNFSLKSIIAIIYLGNFIGIFGILSYFYLQKNIDSLYTSIVFLLFPFIVCIIDKYYYAYNITLFQFLLLIFLVFGMLLTMLPKNILKL
ncbi:DMT family transporter [Buchnera aphidicola (Mollitrichosiphum nigrofasciatum)]|uniref:DMT family transporter n=1 Tax=Buchnera aphidicola TaxID=9 RepID=UPI0031B88B4E